MKETALNEMARNFFAVLSGLIVSIAAGALLYPLVILVVEKNFGFNFFALPGDETWKIDLVLGATFFGWFFMASLAGGFVCSLLSRGNDTMHVLMNSLVSIVIIYILSGDTLLSKKNLLSSLLILLGIPFGNLVGAWLGGRLKKKKARTSS